MFLLSCWLVQLKLQSAVFDHCNSYPCRGLNLYIWSQKLRGTFCHTAPQSRVETWRGSGGFLSDKRNCQRKHVRLKSVIRALKTADFWNLRCTLVFVKATSSLSHPLWKFAGVSFFLGGYIFSPFVALKWNPSRPSHPYLKIIREISCANFFIIICQRKFAAAIRYLEDTIIVWRAVIGEKLLEIGRKMWGNEALGPEGNVNKTIKEVKVRHVCQIVQHMH